MKKKLLFGLVVITLVTISLLAACAEPAPPTPAPPSPAPPTPAPPTPAPPTPAPPTPAPPTPAPPPPGPSPAPTQEPPGTYILRFTTSNPPQAAIVASFQRWLDKIEEETDGRVETELYAGGSLLSLNEQWQGVRDRIADAAFFSLGVEQGTLELLNVTRLPFMGFKSWWQANHIVHDFIWDSPEIPEVWNGYINNGVRPYANRYQPGFQLFTAKDPLRVPDDLKGRKVYAQQEASVITNLAGGAPVSMQIFEVTQALDRGLVEGVWTHFPAAKIFGFLEYCPWVTYFGENGFSAQSDQLLMNAEFWNELPPDIQDIIMGMEDWMIEDEITTDMGEVDSAMAIYAELGHTIVEVTPEEMAIWRELAQPYHEEWIANTEAKGLPAQKVYDKYIKMIEEYPE